MDRATLPLTDQFATVVDWIEQQLDEPLTLERIAVRAGLSPYHFSRLFSARSRARSSACSASRPGDSAADSPLNRSKDSTP